MLYAELYGDKSKKSGVVTILHGESATESYVKGSCGTTTTAVTEHKASCVKILLQCGHGKALQNNETRRVQNIARVEHPKKNWNIYGGIARVGKNVAYLTTST